MNWVNTANFENDFVYWDNFGSHHPKKVLKILEIFKGNICGGVLL